MPHKGLQSHEEEEKKKKGIVVTEKPKEDKVFTDPETGRASGVTIDGRTFLGLTAGDVEKLLRQQQEKEEKVSLTTALKQKQEAKQSIEKLEQAGAFEQVTPTFTELSPDLKTDIPFLTPVAGALSQVTQGRPGSALQTFRNIFPDLFPDIQIGEEAFPIPDTPETLREAAIRQISIDSFNEGVSDAEKFGAYMETLPGFGAIDQWVAGVVEAPHGNAVNVASEIEKIATTATNNQEKTRSGIMPASFAMNRVGEMEDRIAWLEGRLKLLVSQSKILLANTDQVNVWEQAILDAKIRTDNFRQAAALALTAELTGTGRIIPTDEQIFFELMEQRNKK